jgi:hypothetical protein
LDTTHQKNIKVAIGEGLSAMSSEIAAGIAIWNAVSSSNIRFSLVTQNQDILIYDATIGYDICGQADFPSNGAAGANVKIDFTNLAMYLNSYQRTSLIAHELGHTIGFYHTDSPPYGAIHISGTPTGSDVQSMMNSGNCGMAPVDLSDYDKIADATVYPALCGPSSWSLSPSDSQYILSGTTRNYSVLETGLRNLITSTTPTMTVFAYDSVEVIYNGTTYLARPFVTKTIPIAASANCAANPSISVPLTFDNVHNSMNSVSVAIHSVSGDHTFSSGYHTIYVY